MRWNKGITLTEMLVTMALLGIIMLPFSLLIGYGYNSFSNETERSMAMRYAREAMDQILEDLRRNWDSSTSVNANILNITSLQNPNISYMLGTVGPNSAIMRVTTDSAGNTSRRSVFSGRNDEEQINVTSFNVALTPSGTENIIEITIQIRYGRSGVMGITDAFRLKRLN